MTLVLILKPRGSYKKILGNWVEPRELKKILKQKCEDLTSSPEIKKTNFKIFKKQIKKFDKEKYTKELQKDIQAYQEVTNRLTELKKDLFNYRKEKDLEKFKQELQRLIDGQQHLAEQRIALANRILEMQEEEDAFLSLLLLFDE